MEELSTVDTPLINQIIKNQLSNPIRLSLLSKFRKMEEQLNEDIIHQVQVLLDNVPVAKLRQSLESIFKDYILGIKQDAVPNDFEVVVSDYYWLQNFIDKLEGEMK